ncbi:MAG: prolyl oligopeptidase family serine peptidase [Halioglobus sp.]
MTTLSTARFLATIAAISLLFMGQANAESTPSLKQVMANPDWIGNAPTNPWWDASGEAVYYQQKRVNEDFSDTFALALSAPAPEQLAFDDLATAGVPSQVHSPGRNLTGWIHQGDVYLRDQRSGKVKAVTTTVGQESHLVFSSESDALFFEREDQIYRYDIATSLVRQISQVVAEKDPDASPKFDVLRDQQLTTYTTVADDKRRREGVKANQQAKQPMVPTPIYLGDKVEVLQRHISPDGVHLALLLTPSKGKEGRQGKMPNYVTEDGYVAIKDVRTRVGRNDDKPHSVMIVNLETGEQMLLDASSLPGMKGDPLAKLRRSALKWHVEAGADPKDVEKQLKAPKIRSFTVNGLEWSPSGSALAMTLIASDFKDRWLVSFQSGKTTLKLQHQLSDPAWINWQYNQFGWLNDNETLWFLSEESGYSHLYTKNINARKASQLTAGEFVVREPALNASQTHAYVVSNAAHPGNWQVYRVALTGGELERVTSLDGVSTFTLSPDDQQLLVSRSTMARHADLYLAKADGSGEAKQLTDTVTDAYKAIDWSIPEIVEVPSSHTDRPIYSKLYLPRDFDSSKQYPAVMFVHGAGYTQNAHMGWPYYFREFMFHTVLNNAGYIVLDMDYRASEGYGRDWRTSIYRNMGHPELEDHLDGIDYLEANASVDRKRIGIYGGSYGGFMTFMALFRAPDAFAAGAALRPVVDWMHYNHGYTSRILNTPLIDPEAYAKSSPINFVEGLNKPLLIAAGMQDNNVFFQDSVLLVQRLMELEKENFEMAIYPLDAHGFVHASAWLDEYRRIFKLMEANLKP